MLLHIGGANTSHIRVDAVSGFLFLLTPVVCRATDTVRTFIIYLCTVLRTMILEKLN